MTAQEFSSLIYYIKNRPTEALRLREALFDASQEVGDVWLSADKAGEEVNESGRWMRNHRQHFEHMEVKRGSTFAYKFKKGTLKLSYENYLKDKQA